MPGKQAGRKDEKQLEGPSPSPAETVQPPPGTPVKTTVQWEAPAPDKPQPAVEELEPDEPEVFDPEVLSPEDIPDDLTIWLEQFAQEAALDANVVRLADPGHIRPRVPCRELKAFGRIPFRPDTFIRDIQELEGSGGRYKVSLVDPAISRFVPGGSWTGIIADPPPNAARSERDYNNGHADRNGDQTAAPAPPPANEFIQEFQRLLMETMRRNMEKLADPDFGRRDNDGDKGETRHAEVVTEKSEKQVIAEFLMAEPDVRSKVVKNLLSVAGVSSDPDGELNGWQRVALRAVDNPQIVQMLLPYVGNVFELIKRLTPGRAAAPEPTTTTPRDALPPTFIPPPPPQTYEPSPSERGNDEGEAVHYVALDALVASLKINAPISNDEAWLIAIRDNYPTEFQHALTVLKTLPLDAVIMLFSGFDNSYKEALQLPHAREWLTNLQQLAKQS